MPSNLPPGVTESMIPGNRPEDHQWDQVYDWIGSVDIQPIELQNLVLEWAQRNHRDFEVPVPLENDKELGPDEEELREKMIADWMEAIPKMTHEEMARLYRFAPAGHPCFDKSLPMYRAFDRRFTELGGMTEEMSKKIGWRNTT